MPVLTGVKVNRHREPLLAVHAEAMSALDTIGGGLRSLTAPPSWCSPRPLRHLRQSRLQLGMAEALAQPLRAGLRGWVELFRRLHGFPG
jgi:hypothetical protein